MNNKLSLCIPTMDRYDKFLKNYLPKYIQNKHINEIIICDENGNDKQKIDKYFKNKKIRTYINKVRLGPLMNKIKTINMAKNDWVCLIDSDNFVEDNYFDAFIKYCKDKKFDKYNIFLPSWAQPRFDYRSLSGLVISKKNLGQVVNLDKSRDNKLECLMNTGNYIINKHLIKSLNLSNEINNISKSPSCDVIYLNTMLFEQFPVSFHIVPDMFYTHVVHNGSIYIQTNKRFKIFNTIVHNRFKKLY